MKKENRLRKRKQFAYIYKHGTVVFSNTVNLVFIKSKYTPLKVGFSVSKKIGKSVVRSRVKRLMSESFRALMPNVNQHYNYIFIAKEGISQLDYFQVQKQIKSLITRAGLYEEKRLTYYCFRSRLWQSSLFIFTNFVYRRYCQNVVSIIRHVQLIRCKQ